MQPSYSNHLCAVDSGSGEGSQWRWQGDWITQGESLGRREWEVLAGSWKPHATCVIVVSHRLLCFSLFTSSCSSLKHLQGLLLDLFDLWTWPERQFSCNFYLPEYRGLLVFRQQHIHFLCFWPYLSILDMRRMTLIIEVMSFSKHCKIHRLSYSVSSSSLDFLKKKRPLLVHEVKKNI